MPTDSGLDDTTGESTRLRDRAQSEFQQRRQQAAAGSTRLRDRATTAFQKRREQAVRTTEAIATGREEFAGALDLDMGDIKPVQLDDRGEEFGFVPDASGREQLAERFADEREFVDVDDTLVEADPRTGVRPRTDPDRVDEIAADAASEFAAGDEYADPGDFNIDVGPGGVTDAGLTPAGQRRRAGRQFTAETPLESVDPERDITNSEDGFALTDSAARRSAARGFEDDLGAIGQGELDPTRDVRETSGGFGLAESPARRVAAAQIDEQLPEVDVGPDDIDLERVPDGSFEGSFSGEVQR